MSAQELPVGAHLSVRCMPSARSWISSSLQCQKSSATRYALSSKNTHFALSRERYNVQNTPQVDWKGTRYGSGMKRKLTSYVCRMSGEATR